MLWAWSIEFGKLVGAGLLVLAGAAAVMGTIVMLVILTVDRYRLDPLAAFVFVVLGELCIGFLVIFGVEAWRKAKHRLAMGGQ